MIEATFGQSSVRIFPDQESLSAAAAQLFLEVAQMAVAERGLFSVALSGGGTPRALYRLLARPPYDSAVSWAKTHAFWSDERLVPPDDEGSNYDQASADLLNHVAIPPANIHRARGELAAGAAVEAYTAQLRYYAAHTHYPRDAVIPWPRFDLVLLGLGSDGHTASLFPGATTDDWESLPVVAATAEYEGRPAGRLTLTPLVINDARHVLFLVTGKDKAAAVAAVLQGEIDPERWPAQRIRPRAGEVTWMLDADAAARIGYDR
jgi:6-phosphogluconolactonase